MKDGKSKAPPAKPGGEATNVCGAAPAQCQHDHRNQRACLAGKRNRPSDRARRLSARHHPAQREQWSETFDVSRSAVREAIKMLMAKSLLSSRPKVGSWVEPRERWNLLDRDVLAWYAMSPDREAFLRTVQEFRHIIEPEATALAAERRTEEQMAEISQACRDMGTATRCRSAPRRHPLPSRHPARLGQRSAGAAWRADRIGAEPSLRLRDARGEQPAARADAARDDREGHPPAAPRAARVAVRKLLANTDEIITGQR